MSGGGTSKVSENAFPRAARKVPFQRAVPRTPTPKARKQLEPIKPDLTPPSHLSESAQSWWQSAVKEYVLEPHHLRLLQLAGEAWDRAQTARAVIDKDGITFKDDRNNIRAHPAIAIERDARTGFARLVRELDLDVPPPVPGRSGPPSLRSNRR